MTHITHFILALTLVSCASDEPVQEATAGELQLARPEAQPEAEPPCRLGETKLEVPIGSCVMLQGFHWLPLNHRSYGACASHNSVGLCDEPLTVCLGQGTEAVISDVCEPCDPSEVGEWGWVE